MKCEVYLAACEYSQECVLRLACVFVIFALAHHSAHAQYV